jgi:hypothetical protein
MWFLGPVLQAVGGIAQAAVKGDAERKAINTQMDAIKALKGIDVPAVAKTTAARDIAFYTRSLEEFRKANPDLAAAGAAAETGLRRTVEGAERDFAAADELFAQQVREAQAVSPVAEEIRRELLAQTRENLRRGAQLPPEFQAELVRTGLEEAAATGIGGNRTGPVAARLGTLLGSAGLQLESQRRAEAAQALQLNDLLTQSRQRILGDLVTQSTARPATRAGFYGNVQQGVAQQIRPVGLTGRDQLAMDLQNLDLENQKALQVAGLRGQKALSQASMINSMIESGTNMFGGLLGGAAGGGGFGSLFGGGASGVTKGASSLVK